MLVLATHNKNKLRELASMLSDCPVRVEGIGSFPGAPTVEETRRDVRGKRRAESASRGAAHRAFGRWPTIRVWKSMRWTAGPGVYSARFAGPDATDADNNAKLLRLLADVPDGAPHGQVSLRDRRRRPMATYSSRRASARGSSPANRGEGGFGYDRLFIVPEYGRTFAELPPEVKDRISHRARALAAAGGGWPKSWAGDDGSAALRPGRPAKASRRTRRVL